MKNKSYILYFVAFISTITLFTSCYSTQEIAYFQDFDKYEQGEAEVKIPDNYLVRAQVDDELLIMVSTPLNPEAAMPFNLSPYSQQNPSSTERIRDGGGGGSTYLSYLVDINGDITIPSLGKVRVLGLTMDEIQSEVQNKLKAYLKDPIVTVRLVSFRISVLGEVNIPGVKSFQRQRVTILDAITASGDLTIFAERHKIQLLRDNNGKKEFYTYDFTKTDFLSSPYFYLKPNDVIYAVPNKERQSDSDIGTGKQYRSTLTMSIVSVSLGLISTIATIFAISK